MKWPTTRALLKHVGIPADARVLDLGCGGGDVTVELAALALEGSVVGADLDETQLAVAREEAARAGVSNVEYRVADVAALGNDNERFDVVYCRSC